MINNKSLLDYNKPLNSKCICGSALIWKKYNQIMLEPCEHLIHCKCFNMQKDQMKCPICKINITGYNTLKGLQCMIKSKSFKKNNMNIFYQKYIDMISMSNFDDLYDGKRNMFNMIDLVGIASIFPFLSGHNDGKNSCKEVFSLMNSKFIVKGMENIDRNSRKVFIVNHTTYLDFLVVFYLFKCGFLASSIIKDSWIGRQLMNIIPLLIIERGKDVNTVEKMKQYVKKNGSICLFPEGMITHPDTIIRFRTGAFHTGFPINPIVLRYDPIVYDTDMNKLVEKISSQPNVTIYVDILPTEYPPFDTIKIEKVREKMGKAGNIALSRVSNRDIKD